MTLTKQVQLILVFPLTYCLSSLYYGRLLKITRLTYVIVNGDIQCLEYQCSAQSHM